MYNHHGISQHHSNAPLSSRSFSKEVVHVLYRYELDGTAGNGSHSSRREAREQRLRPFHLSDTRHHLERIVRRGTLNTARHEPCACNIKRGGECLTHESSESSCDSCINSLHLLTLLEPIHLSTHRFISKELGNICRACIRNICQPAQKFHSYNHKSTDAPSC